MDKRKRVETKYSVALPAKYGEEYRINRKFLPDGPGDLAYDLIRHWGRTSLMPDPGNEGTTKGGSAWVLMPIEELVTRALDTAEAFYAELHKRGLMLELDFPESPEEE